MWGDVRKLHAGLLVPRDAVPLSFKCVQRDRPRDGRTSDGSFECVCFAGEVASARVFDLIKDTDVSYVMHNSWEECIP